MKVKDLLKVIPQIFNLLLLVAAINYVVMIFANPSPEALAQGKNLVAQAAIEWWISPLKRLAQYSGFLALLFIFILNWADVIKVPDL